MIEPKDYILKICINCRYKKHCEDVCLHSFFGREIPIDEGCIAECEEENWFYRKKVLPY